jgi:hypothetical protein
VVAAEAVAEGWALSRNSYLTPSANIPNLPNITPDMSQGMPGAAAIGQLLALAGSNGYQLGDQQRIAFAQAQARAEQDRAERSLQQQMAERDQAQQQADENRFIQLAQAGIDLDAADSLTPRKRPALYAVGEQIQKQQREAKKLEEEQAQQRMNRGGWSTALPGLVAMDDAEARRQLEGTGPQRYGRPLPDLLAELAAAEAMDTRKRADYEADQARRDARANRRAQGAGGSGLTPAQEADAELKLRDQYVQEVRPVLDAVGQAHSAIQVSAQPVTAGSEQIIRDTALVNAYARMLQSVGVLTDRDIDRAAGRIPGVIGSAQQFFSLATEGSTLDEGRRKEILINLRKLARFGETRAKDTEGFLARNAKKRGLKPEDVFTKGLMDVPSGESGAAPVGPPPPAPGPVPAGVPDQEAYRKARVGARKFLGREPTDEEVVQLMRMRGQ